MSQHKKKREKLNQEKNIMKKKSFYDSEKLRYKSNVDTRPHESGKHVSPWVDTQRQSSCLSRILLSSP